MFVGCLFLGNSGMFIIVIIIRFFLLLLKVVIVIIIINGVFLSTSKSLFLTLNLLVKEDLSLCGLRGQTVCHAARGRIRLQVK